jgi:hypothetical protein
VVIALRHAFLVLVIAILVSIHACETHSSRIQNFGPWLNVIFVILFVIGIWAAVPIYKGVTSRAWRVGASVATGAIATAAVFWISIQVAAVVLDKVESERSQLLVFQDRRLQWYSPCRYSRMLLGAVPNRVFEADAVQRCGLHGATQRER